MYINHKSINEISFPQHTNWEITNLAKRSQLKFFIYKTGNNNDII